MKKHIVFTLVIMLVVACNNSKNKKQEDPKNAISVENLLTVYNQKIIDAAKTKSFEVIEELYDQESLLMTDYNPLIEGNQNIKTYYNTIFNRNGVKEYDRKTVDILEFPNRIIEIGLFTKVFADETKVKGKYLNVWKKDSKKKLKLRAESFGYLQPIDDPTVFLVPEASNKIPNPIQAPRELAAYSALGKSNVKARIPERTADSYTDDAMYLPFADTIKTGKSVLIEHYKGYYKHPATIDSIEIMTYAYDKVGDGYIKYGGFYVDWSVPGYSGNSTGTGISYWRRGKDNSLRIHRQIGLHIHK
ncbi:hypothetical protein [Aquimarina litoralis]|uniref:hypothetical protein n=1 Tax=Aquimarina litoralis TaxID=584605 RepID=UPI001C591062|nr:hypothetical protein [Aquimarina litoralis]MBW1297750.1 hypothetical protein [Aquimarina litoralis]